MNLDKAIIIKTTEMHTGGGALRIIESGYPPLKGDTVLEKRKYCRKHVDHIRRFLMFEPRGHFDMYGALLIDSELEEADFGVLFMHNKLDEGYSAMCGHAIIALGRYAVEKGLVPGTRLKQPETEVNIHCPCGLVKTFVEYDGVKGGAVRYHSTPAFAFQLDVSVDVVGHGKVKVDVGYGGAFYAIARAEDFGINFDSSSTKLIIETANRISDAVKKKVTLRHPDSSEFVFLYGTILTDGNDANVPGSPSINMVVFADREVDRSACGSGVTARIAVQHARGQIDVGQRRVFVSGTNNSHMTGSVVRTTQFGEFDAVIVEIAGKGYYSGNSEFSLEEEDPLKAGFLLD